MIPKNITSEHVLRAIRKFERDGVPAGRESRKFPLRHEGKTYPSKYVISLANKYANGAELNPSEFSGGRESTGFLAALGFSVGEASSSTEPAPEVARQAAEPRRAGARQHDERCKACKAAVQDLLEKGYGRVEKTYKFQVGTRPEDFKDTAYYGSLKAIYKTLQNHRGFNEFVKSETLPHCDFFVPNPGFIVEFDESQHYTLPRKIALEKYPMELSLGFSREKWVLLCEELNKRDDEPPYRDEQRAWYDTLRDFVAPVKGLKPTVRLYARDLQWCGLDCTNPNDVQRFRSLVENRSREPKGWVATVIVQSNMAVSNEERLSALAQIVDSVVTKTQGDGVILLPGGWFSAREKEARTLYPWIEEGAPSILAGNIHRNLVVALGVDGKVTQYGTDQITGDQIAMAVSKKGIEAIGRKFYAAPPEKGRIDLAPDWLARENSKLRIFELNGRKYFLCACYDSFGIKKGAIPNPGIDVVLDLVHGFHRPGHGGSGASYFARHGFAGTSKHWQCLVFGAAVFFKRRIPEDWPSGVFWNQGGKSTQVWRYADNPLRPSVQFEFPLKEGLASTRVFDLEQTPRATGTRM